MTDRIKYIVRKIITQTGYDIIKKREENSYSLSSEHREKIVRVSKAVGRVQYGSGDKILENWLNIDLGLADNLERSPYVLSVDLSKPHPFEDNTFMLGFSEDFIEHLEQEDQLIFLVEAFRTFKTGGVLRLSFPGLEGVLLNHYHTSTVQIYETAKKEAYRDFGHKHFFSKDELKYVCKHIGFSMVRFVEYGISIVPELCNLDTRLDQLKFNTYIEIVK